MKAYAYVEQYSNTAGTHNPGALKPQTYYTLAFSLWSSFRSGVGSITTTDPLDYQKIVKEQEARGVKVITSRLPFVSIDSTVCVDEDSGLTAHVHRIPYDKVA